MLMKVKVIERKFYTLYYIEYRIQLRTSERTKEKGESYFFLYKYIYRKYVCHKFVVMNYNKTRIKKFYNFVFYYPWERVYFFSLF